MQAAVRHHIRHLKLALVILLETKVKHSSYNYIVNSVVPSGWRESSNIATGSTARIWVLWDPRLVHVTVNASTNQCMHCEVIYGTKHFFLIACYGSNDYMQRRELWKTIRDLSLPSGLPWIVAGHFNTVRWTHEKRGGATPRARGLIELNDCHHDAGLLDLKLTGPLFTWSNSSFGASRIECKLDRVLINDRFLHCNPFQGDVLMPGLSDHSPILLSLHVKAHIKASFRYYTFWAKMPGFFPNS
ncbi:hypothetical protein AAC387_Pa09g0941 [Persea americana]